MTYTYTCSSEKGCGHTFDRSMSVKDWKEKVKCPKCGKMAHQNLLEQHKGGEVDSQMKEYTMEGSNGCRMYAASYLPHQMSEARRVHPGRKFKLINGCYIPDVRNRTDRKKYLKEMNYIEYD